HRVAVNAEGRFLAHWDEFVEHRKEVQAKLEEAFEMASERREAGLRLAILCQQLETKVERLARQSKDQLSNGEILEDRLSSQAKSVEACKEAIEVLRDKIQRQVQDLNASLVSVKTELSEEVEKQHQSLQEAMRRGDRCLAEEFFRKLQETSEKKGSSEGLGLKSE
ncbi:cAMP-dependent protein kinase regulatory subunit, partial [Durusdinium trenchii]